MESIKVGVVGMGFIGPAHIDAIRRLGFVDVIALSDMGQERADAMAAKLGVSRAYGDFRGMLADPDVQVIHNCTPNHIHYEINRAAILAGKHVMSEKPLALNTKQSAELVFLAREHKVVNGVNFNYRQYPLVQHLQAAVARGELGTVHLVHGNYLQDWLLYDTDFNWRVTPEVGGASRAVADIGSHWIDTVQYVIGQEVTEVFADLGTVYPVRKRLTTSKQTFSSETSNEAEYEEVPVHTEDYASVLLRFSDGARGSFTVSQVSAGRKNHLSFQVDCSEESVAWSQEQPHQLWIGHRDRPNEVMMADPALLMPEARDYIHYPGGHNEGWPDALKNNIRNFYRFIREGKQPMTDPADFATFLDGHKTMQTVEAILESHCKGRWVKVQRAVNPLQQTRAKSI